MPSRYPNTLVDKFLRHYFRALTKKKYVVEGQIFQPLPLVVHKELAANYRCHQCGACCKRFSLDYLPQDDFQKIETATIKINVNGKDYNFCTHKQEMPKQKINDFCEFLEGNCETARCEIYAQRPLSCDFELIRISIHKGKSVIKVDSYKHRHYDPQYQFRHEEREEDKRGYKNIVPSRFRSLCEYVPPSQEGANESGRKLRRLLAVADYFAIETWIPEIIEYLEGGRWAKGSLYLGGPEEALSKPTRRTAKEKQLLFNLIAKGRYTRQQIIQKLLDANPNAPVEVYSSWLTNAQKPKHNLFKWRVLVGEDGIWRFE